MRPLLREFIAAVRIETRRPAAVVACAGGLIASLALAMRARALTGLPVEILVGGLLAVAALGELPSGLGDAVRRRTFEPFIWAVARTLFPLVGVAVAAVAAGGPGLSRVAFAIVATGITQAVVQTAGVRGSEPATTAVLAAAAAAGAAAAGLPFEWLTAVWAGAVWAVGRLARIVLTLDRLESARGRGRTVWLWPLPSQGRLRPAMTALAMVVGLAGMACWLVQQPPRADRYAALASVLFIALAIPQMTLGDGIVDRLGWAVVLRPPGGEARGARVWPPAGRISFAHAAMFVWPVVVAGVLTTRQSGTLLADASVIAGVLLLAGVAVAIAWILSRSPETSQATILAVFATLCGWGGVEFIESIRVFAAWSP